MSACALMLLGAGSAHATLSYQYTALPTSPTVPANTAVNVNLYLVETVTGGTTSLLVPAGGDVWSDPVRLQMRAGDDLAISFYVSGSFVPPWPAGGATVYHTPG